MTYKTDDGVEATEENVGDEIDSFLGGIDLQFVYGENGEKYMVSAKVTFVLVED